MVKKYFYMIGNAHIDPVWLWNWNEGLEVVLETFRNALKLMEKNSRYKFTASSTIFYKWVKELDKNLFNKIREKVFEDRWYIAGGWIVEPDCNIPCGESFVRHSLYGQRFLLENFGKICEIGYNIDSFGHNWMLPQILSKSGIKYYIFMRPKPDEKTLPENIFWWESPDGSRVLAYRIPISYTLTGERIGRAIEELDEKSSRDYVMLFYGRGDHGGGPVEEDLKIIERYGERVRMSIPIEFFKKILEKYNDIPVVRDDLQHHARGCYSSHSKIKYLNRLSEATAIYSEIFATISKILLDEKYPKKTFREIWLNILFNQFHDILAGTSIWEAYEDVIASYDESISRARKILYKSIYRLALNIDTSKYDGIPIIVFNPSSWTRVSPVEVELSIRRESISIINENGDKIPVQIEDPSAVIRGGRIKIIFIAKVPAFGYRVYWLIREPPPNVKNSLKINGNILENDFIRMEIDEKTGYIGKLYDKIHDINVFKESGAVPIVIDDPSDTWSHGVDRYDDIIGCFDDASIKIVEKGPIRIGIEVENRYNSSILRQTYYVYDLYNIVESRVYLNWFEKRKLLKLVFPINVENPKAIYSIPYGFIERNIDGYEEPGQGWIDVYGDIDGRKYGVSLINNAKYSYDVRGSILRLTILRSPIYAQHNHISLDPGKTYRFIDQGIQEFKYLLIPHIGDWREARPVHKFWELVMPLTAIYHYRHKGKLPSKLRMIEVESENIIASVLKECEDDNDIIIRLYETDGKPVKANISMPYLNLKWSAEFKRNEIKTFKIPFKRKGKIKEVNLLEL